MEIESRSTTVKNEYVHLRDELGPLYAALGGHIPGRFEDDRLQTGQRFTHTITPKQGTPVPMCPECDGRLASITMDGSFMLATGAYPDLSCRCVNGHTWRGEPDPEIEAEFAALREAESDF